MKRNGEIEICDIVHCLECGKTIQPSDKYHIIKRNRKLGGKFIHIHKDCYEDLLPKNIKQER